MKEMRFMPKFDNLNNKQQLSINANKMGCFVQELS